MVGWYCMCQGYYMPEGPWVPEEHRIKVPVLLVRTHTQEEAEEGYRKHLREVHGGEKPWDSQTSSSKL